MPYSHREFGSWKMAWCLCCISTLIAGFRTKPGCQFENGIKALACSCQVPSRARISVFGRFSVLACFLKGGFPSDGFYKHIKLPLVSYAFLIRETLGICALPPLNTKYSAFKKHILPLPSEHPRGLWRQTLDPLGSPCAEMLGPGSALASGV